MSPIIKIGLRRIKGNTCKSMFLIIAIFLSMTLISLFAFFELQTMLSSNPAYKNLPFAEFMGKVRAYLNVTIAFLILITFIILRIHCGMRKEENSQILAVLTSVGATGEQKRMLLLIDVFLLYLPPTVLGVIIGIVPGVRIGNYFQGIAQLKPSDYLTYLFAALIIIAIAFLLIIMCNFLPDINLRRISVIQIIKKRNAEAPEMRHGYRQSKTYRRQSLLKRLAKKSVDYYSKSYNRIAATFAFSALYPALAVLLLWYIGKTDLVIDSNPYDAIDTSGAVLSAADKLLLFLGVCFLALAFMGLLQAVIMSRMQIAERKKSVYTYWSVGMSKADINKMIHLELRSVVIKVMIIFVISIIVISACFGMV